MAEACYFYISYKEAKKPEEGIVLPLCLECGKKWKDAYYWDGGYGPWEIKCGNPLCSTPGGKIIWKGEE